MRSFFFLLMASVPAICPAAGLPVVSGDWVELRKSPVFESEIVPLAKTWGGHLPPGTEFRVEKVYGRWLYGTPEPLPRMLSRDYAKPGWVYSRMMLVPGDVDTKPAKVRRTGLGVYFHGREAWKKLGLGDSSVLSRLEFYESLVISERTLKGFTAQDETSAPKKMESLLNSLLPDAHAEEPPSLGITGTDLSFLDHEFQIAQKKKSKEKEKVRKSTLRVPNAPTLDEESRAGVLGRFMIQKYLDLPVLTHEEVDGYAYMRVVALRSLRGCNKEIASYWQNRRWSFVRAFRLKSRPEEKNPWLEISLPGGYFVLSARAVDLADNEAELAYLLLRPMVKAWKQKPPLTALAKGWPASLQERSEEIWQGVMKPLNVNDPAAPDVSADLAIDQLTFQCLEKAGYASTAGLRYLEKLEMNKDEPWTKWYFDHAIGTPYRIERNAALLSAKPEDATLRWNANRFQRVSKQWNILP